MISKAIFYARSDKAPPEWSFDHVGFVVGRQFVQMSGHRLGEGVYVVNKMSDDPAFSSDQVKIVPLGRSVEVPTKMPEAENCGTFVHLVLKLNGIDLPVESILL